jgi:hypothetical protein
MLLVLIPIENIRHFKHRVVSEILERMFSEWAVEPFIRHETLRLRVNRIPNSDHLVVCGQ